MNEEPKNLFIYFIYRYQKSPISEKVQIFATAGVLGFLGVVFYLISSNKIELYYQYITGTNGERIALLLTSSIILCFSYFIASVVELDWASKFYPNLIPSPKIINIFLSISFGIFLSLLCYFTYNLCTRQKLENLIKTMA